MIQTFASSLQNELRQTVDKMADKLEKETKANEEAAKRIEELTAQVNELNNKVCVNHAYQGSIRSSEST